MNSQYVVVGVVALVIGLAFAGASWNYILPYRQDTQNAQAVDAEVVSSAVTEGYNSENQRVYGPHVVYRYTYDGTEYTSDSVFPGDADAVSEESRARDIVEQYAAGDEVTAYVNRDDPERAFLIDQSAPLWFWLGPVVSGLLVLYGGYSTVLGLRGVDPTGQPVAEEP